MSAVCNVKRLSKGKYTWVYHFDSKAEAVEYVQERYPELAAKMSVVHIGVYMNNSIRIKPTKVCPTY